MTLFYFVAQTEQIKQSSHCIRLYCFLAGEWGTTYIDYSVLFLFNTAGILLLLSAAPHQNRYISIFALCIHST